MASEGDRSLQFAGMVGNSFNFQVGVPGTDFEIDAFKRLNDSSINWIKCSDGNFLVVHSEGRLLFEDLNKEQRCQAECKFIICPYDGNQPVEGMAVMLVAIKSDERKVVCCNLEGEIYAEKWDIPVQVDTNGHKALFFQRGVAGRGNTFMFESSLCKSHFLGVKTDEELPALCKLVLHSCTDYVDESCHMKLDQCRHELDLTI